MKYVSQICVLAAIYFLISLPISVFAQKDFRPGYIITLDGDTVNGKIDYRGDILMCEVCRFIRSDQEEMQEFKPDQIAGYRLVDGKYFVSKEIYGRLVFLEFLIQGEVSIYYFRDELRDYYFMEKEGYDIVEIPYEEGVVYKDDKPYSFKTTAHLRLLNEYMQDAPGFESRISRVVKPEHRNLIRLAEAYHNKVCLDEACIIYEKKSPFLKVNLELVSGFTREVDAVKVGLVDRNYLQNGFLIHFWLPRANEKFFFKTGLLMSTIEDKYGRVILFPRIPLHIAYMMPATYRIRATASMGFIRPSYSGGVNLRITKRINLGVQGWANFYGYLIFPGEFENYSLLGNLYFDL